MAEATPQLAGHAPGDGNTLSLQLAPSLALHKCLNRCTRQPAQGPVHAQRTCTCRSTRTRLCAGCLQGASLSRARPAALMPAKASALLCALVHWGALASTRVTQGHMQGQAVYTCRVLHQGVFLQPLADKFTRLALQLLARFASWLAAGLQQQQQQNQADGAEAAPHDSAPEQAGSHRP